MTATVIAVGILVLAGLGALLFLWRSARGRRRQYENIPPGMRPAYSDEQLERGVLERYMAWGLVLTVFFAIFFPIYWVTEANRLQAETEGFFLASVERGGEDFGEFCAECHGANAAGGFTQSPYADEPWPAPNLTNIAARYADSPTIDDVEEYLIDTIQRGRAGTPMPTWGAEFGGPLTDQQVRDIAAWILANQVNETAEATSAQNMSGEELFAGNCARCHGPEGEGIVGPSLVGVFERHSEETILGILRNGVRIGGAATTMPPWQNGYMYAEGHFNDEALTKIVDYLRELQPAQLPPDADTYQAPFQGPDDEDGGSGQEQPSEEPTEEGTEA